MVSPPYQSRYQTLKQQVQVVERLAIASQPDVVQVQAAFQQAQQWFQQAILDDTEAAIPEAIAGEVQAYGVELNKQMRLLGVDVMFLQSSRQAQTRMQRQAQMRDRLQLLQTYCDRVLALGSDPAAADGPDA